MSKTPNAAAPAVSPAVQLGVGSASPSEPLREWWEQLCGNPFISLSMVGLFVWGLCVWFTVNNPETTPLLLAVCAPACVLALGFVRPGAIQTGVISAIVLVIFAIIGVFGSNESISNLFALYRWFFGNDFVATDRQRWEVVALLSTAFMLIIYYDSVDIVNNGFVENKRKKGLKIYNILTLLSLIVFFSASLSLHYPRAHYLSVLGLAATFAAIDLFLWMSLDNSNSDQFVKELRHYSRCLFLMLDLPVFIGLFILTVYFLRVDCGGWSVLQIIGRTINVSNESCLEAHPFMAGAVAFQMISFNVIYVCFTFGAHK